METNTTVIVLCLDVENTAEGNCTRAEGRSKERSNHSPRVKQDIQRYGDDERLIILGLPNTVDGH